MATTNLNVRVDENLKKTADTLLNELGLNMSTNCQGERHTV